MKALSYIASRALQAFIVLIGVSAIVFFALFLTGDPAALMMPPEASKQEIAAFREAMGFNDPIFLQYGRFLLGALHGDLGISLRFQRPAYDLVLERLPATALLATAALAWSSLLGFALGIIAASLIDALAQDYVRTARAKGLSQWRIMMRHALRNALIPVVTVQGMYFASLLGGALITEVIFAWPGLGRLAIESIQNKDFPVVQAVVLFAALVFVVANFLVDLAYAALNPRIRL